MHSSPLTPRAQLQGNFSVFMVLASAQYSLPLGQSQSIAYIDGANLHKSISVQGWNLDYRRFRTWIRQKYGVQIAYIFIGMVERYSNLYTFLKEAGFILLFKEVVFDGSGKAKGNCDADLVLQAVRDHFEAATDSVVLISSDGDYASLIKFWQEKNVVCTILSPSPQKKCSILLKKTGASIVYLDELKHKISRDKNKRAPDTDVSV